MSVCLPVCLCVPVSVVFAVVVPLCSRTRDDVKLSASVCDDHTTFNNDNIYAPPASYPYQYVVCSAVISSILLPHHTRKSWVLYSVNRSVTEDKQLITDCGVNYYGYYCC